MTSKTSSPKTKLKLKLNPEQRKALKAQNQQLTDATKKLERNAGKPVVLKKNSVRARLDAEQAALEAAIAKDKEDAKKGVNLSGITRQLLDRAIQLVMRNDGSAIPDKIGAAKVKSHHDLLVACRGKLTLAIKCIMEAPTPDDLTKRDQRPARVFSLLSAVMKSIMFVANGRYQLWLNGRDAPLFAARDDHRSAPYGLEFRPETHIDAELAMGIEEAQAWFGGLCEALGYDLREQPFPLAYTQDEKGEWLPITSIDEAYAAVESRAQSAKVRRLENESKARMEAVQRALAAIAASEQEIAA